MTTEQARGSMRSTAGFVLVALSLGATQWKLSYAQGFFGFAAILWVIDLVQSKRPLTTPAFFRPLAVYGALTLLSAAFSGNPLASFIDSKQLVLFLLVPVAFALSILRYGLYDIDLVIRRTLQYGVLTLLLALVFFGAVTLLTSLLAAVTGQQSALALVIATLLIAALFNPLRRRIQNGIDRRFFRRKYDAQQVLARFAMTARNETDLDALTSELVRVVQETMEPATVSIWLRK